MRSNTEQLLEALRRLDNATSTLQQSEDDTALLDASLDSAEAMDALEQLFQSSSLRYGVHHNHVEAA